MIHFFCFGSFRYTRYFINWLLENLSRLEYKLLTLDFCCSYLLILDRTNWKTNILTSLLVPYIFLSLPSVLFNFFRWTFLFSHSICFLLDGKYCSWRMYIVIFRGEVGKWIAFVAVVLRLFFPRHFPGMNPVTVLFTICDRIGFHFPVGDPVILDACFK